MWRYLSCFIALLYRRVWNWLVICPVVCRFVPYTMPSLLCYRKKHKYFGLSHVREGQRSVVISVKVAVVVSVNLRHQRFDNFHKILQKTLSGLETSLYMWCFIAFLPLGALSKACTGLLWDQRGRFHCEVDRVWTCWRGPLWKIASFAAFEENELLDAWPLVVGRSGGRYDTPGSSSKPPSSSEVLSLGVPAS